MTCHQKAKLNLYWKVRLIGEKTILWWKSD